MIQTLVINQIYSPTDNSQVSCISRCFMHILRIDYGDEYNLLTCNVNCLLSLVWMLLYAILFRTPSPLQILFTMLYIALSYIPCWRNDMNTLSALMALCNGNPPISDGFPSSGACDADLWRFLCCQTRVSCWTNSQVAGDLRHHNRHVHCNDFLSTDAQSTLVRTYHSNHNDDTWASWPHEIPATRLFVQQLVQVNDYYTATFRIIGPCIPVINELPS